MQHTAAEQERLGLYLLGALDEREREAFEAHLAACWRCLDEASAMAPSATGLAELDEDDWPTPYSAHPARRPAPPPEPARRLSTRPASRGDAKRPPARPGGRRRLSLWAGSALAALVMAVTGGLLLAGQEPPGNDIVLTASGEARAAGTSLSVVITTRERGDSTIRITVTGLRPGVEYRMYAVTRDSVTHEIREWTATAGPHDVAGETSLPVADLSFVSIGPAEGAAVVSAPIVQG